MITPPQVHINFDILSSAGALQSMTVGAPATQGEKVAGMHGCGVRTPIAAAVAAATWGLDGDMHAPNGGILAVGLWSRILAATILLVITVFGVGIKLLGAMPKLHFIIAPMQVCIAISAPLSQTP
jgi:hypothetical protein